MKSKIIHLVAVLTIVLSLFTYNVFALPIDNTTVRFIDGESEWIVSYIQLRTPCRDGSGNDYFETINSKNNQPRSAGSAPHRGVDLNMNWSTDQDEVYCPYAGTVRKSEGYYLSVEIFSNTYASFIHIVPYVDNGDAVTENEPIARIGRTSENGGYAEHLHFGFTETKDMIKWITVGPRYKSYSGWNFGMDCDYVGKPYFSSNNELYVHAYTWNDGILQECEKVELWYRIGDSNWIPVAMNPTYYMDGEAYRWSVDFDEFASSGQTVDWYVAAYRDVEAPYDTFDESSEPHNWALFPAKYAHPDGNGNNDSPAYEPVQLN